MKIGRILLLCIVLLPKNNANATEIDPVAGAMFQLEVSLFVTRSQNVSFFNYFTKNLTTLAPGDFVKILPSTISLSPGANKSKAIAVSISSHFIYETSETFYASLSNPKNTTLTVQQGQGTILDDELPSLPTLSDVTLEEYAGIALLSLSLDRVSEVDFTSRPLPTIFCALIDYTLKSATVKTL